MRGCARGHSITLFAAKLSAFFPLFLTSLLALPASALNNCADGDFQDQRGQAEIQIANDNPTNPFVYRPRCVTISEGTRILFRALPNFGMHPLYGGVVSGGSATIDPDSPIGSMSSGTEIERTIFDSGEFPYFCDVHFGNGMTGSVRVVPQLFADGFD